ncbi:MAG: peptidylprolyl isomerase [Deltaproteobacteria bacterium]|nr:peptidylprolyl isomerase [Deltaproteobacteria bacterium]MBW2393439.1 peptidylprolyl isomerase [Deltaproteobacteria bacterium]
MLRALREGSRWFMILIIGAIAVVFTLYLGGGGSNGPAEEDGVVVRVGPRSFDLREVDRVKRGIEATYRQALGDGYDPEAAAAFLDESAASSLLQIGLYAFEAERMGLVVGDREVRNYLHSLPGVLDEEGKLNQDLVRNYAEREFGSLLRFQEALRSEILQRKLQRLLWQSVDVSDAEARDSLRYSGEQVKVALVTFDGSKRPEGLEATEEAVQALLDNEPEQLLGAYEKRRSEFDRPEEVRARHILIRKAEDGDEAAATAAGEKLDAALARLEGGEAFADVAAELSDDPGSKARGGDLGFFSRGRMVKEFEDVAFNLEPGQASEVVESSFGKHIILVEEKRAAQITPFEEAREQIARDLALTNASDEAAREQAEALAERVRAGEALVDAAREEEIVITRPDPLRRRPDGFVPGLGAVPELLAAAFALTDESPSDPTVHEIGDRKFVLIQLVERTGPTDDQLEEGADAERERLLNERRQATTTAWMARVREELQEAGELVYDLSQLN